MTNPVSFERLDNGRYAFRGELNMHSVPSALARANALLSEARGEVVIDLQGVERSDSAGLALLIACLRLAERHGFSLQFQHVPAQLLQIARVSELEPLIPIR